MFHKFAKIYTEMKKILTFLCVALVCAFDAGGATRAKNTNRTKNSSIITNEKTTRILGARSTTKNTSAQTNRSAIAPTQKTVVLRSNQKNTLSRSTTSRTATAPTRKKNTTARATATQSSSNMTETKTGAEYEKCKNSFFACMDQFCELKNDSFRRCSCSDRVYKFQDIYDNYQDVSERLTEFSENLSVVGMTKEQASAMKTSSEGEDALTEDKSASKQLLQAIMNAIRGDDATVGGKYTNLNSVSVASDMSNAFGLEDTGQLIASYNGATLYKAVYPKCKAIVQSDCNNASLQRAINAYLMAIEQDCNTVETALQKQRKTLKASTHENSAMLDLARVENHKKNNADDIATCISNIESAIKSEEVCGSNYHKCLDNGQFIDVSTGAPITGVVDFYKLGELLTFKNAENLHNQKLSSLSNNRNFVQSFENKTKKFAQNALSTCSDQADTAWQQYMDMALLDIYYAQQAKVSEIQQNCFDLITACHENQNTAIATAMAAITGDNSILLKPASISLTSQICSNYIESCNNMFNGNVVASYIKNKNFTDSETACRAIAQQCFDKFGGTGYENFYSLQSGLFLPGTAIDWFTLYDQDKNIISPCAKELATTEGCTDSELLQRVFGGFDKYVINGENSTDSQTFYTIDNGDVLSGNDQSLTGNEGRATSGASETIAVITDDRIIRSTGIATEVYAKIIDNLKNQCETVKGYFIESKNAKSYGYNPDNFCLLNTSSVNSMFYINPVFSSPSTLNYWYNFIENENVCPAGYMETVDTQSWGICSCWENGGYRSQNGTSNICRALLPMINSTGAESGALCTHDILPHTDASYQTQSDTKWCQQSLISSFGQVCPDTFTAKVQSGLVPNALTMVITTNSLVTCADENQDAIAVVLEKVPQHTVPNSVTTTILQNVANHINATTNTTSSND